MVFDFTCPDESRRGAFTALFDARKIAQQELAIALAEAIMQKDNPGVAKINAYMGLAEAYMTVDRLDYEIETFSTEETDDDVAEDG